MTPLSPAQLRAVIDTTWPPARISQQDPWTLRVGDGGGKRVSAATTTTKVSQTDVRAAEDAMRGFGQTPLFQLYGTEPGLDDMLAAQGYLHLDRTILYLCALAELDTKAPSPLTTLRGDTPLPIMREIWAAGGIGPARVAIMERAPGPKTMILGRLGDRPVGAAFVAASGPIAMIHAIEVLCEHRRRGAGRNMLARAAVWARDAGCTHLSLLVTEANVSANALYRSLGMVQAGSYHYRMKPGTQNR
ncbi:MAG: GNAT family N-acetyltransferase [Alphaproteobacteria bacterium]|nr:GNAT family N-acetyltransferase [Alphaproteobacteria bacterium]NNF24765.1 GNAT family N-acetyltransferase [Paracoccaceae bacterium]